MEQKECFKEGYLVKKSQGRHRWKTRWFVLEPEALCYYRKKDRETVKGRIRLAGAAVSFPVTGYEKREGVFVLCTSEAKEYLLRAPNDIDREVWCHGIGGAIRSLESKAPQKSTEAAKSISATVNLSDILGAMQDPDAGVTMSRYVLEDTEYDNCFSGATVVDWLLDWSFAKSREMAASIAEELLRLAHILPLINNSEPKQENTEFSDDAQVYYRFSTLTHHSSKEVLDDSSSESSDSSEGELSEGDILDKKPTKGKPIKEGFLMKRGHLRRKWKARKVVVKDKPASLTYYSTSKNVQEPLKVINLENCFVLDSQTTETQDLLTALSRKKKHVFCIQRADGSIIALQAEDEHERREWVRVIQQVCGLATPYVKLQNSETLPKK